MKSQSETIPGTYSVVKMPDGSTELFEKIKDSSGKTEWVMVKDRVKEEEDIRQFEERFNSTVTKPANFEPSTEGSLTKKPSKANTTKAHLMAHLIEALGDPVRILAQGKLDTAKYESLRKNTALKEQTLKIISALDVEEWNNVRKLI